jgi:hypothetical protein
VSTAARSAEAEAVAMTVSPAVAVAGCGLWLPGHPSLATWRAGAAETEITPPQGRDLGRMNRRRASLLGRALADVGFEAMLAAEVDPVDVRTVVGSSIAEVSTMLGLLEQIWRTHEPVSPAAFTVSVHNAASGLISIATGNRGFTTSLAADDDTPAVALLEAMGLVLCSGQPVLVACGDEASPQDLVPDACGWGMAAAAIVLAPIDQAGARRTSMRITRPGRPDLPLASVDTELARNPQIGLVDLVDAITRGRKGTVGLDRGAGQGWCAEIEPASGA